MPYHSKGGDPLDASNRETPSDQSMHGYACKQKQAMILIRNCHYATVKSMNDASGLKSRAEEELGKGNFAEAEVLYYDLIDLLYRSAPGAELGEAFKQLAGTLKAQKKDYSQFLVLADKLLNTGDLADLDATSRTA